jgi:hypothetical protein
MISINLKPTMRFLTTVCLLVYSHLFIFAQNMGVKMPVSTLPNTTLDVNGSVAFREGTALTLANGSNEVSLASSDYSLFRITGPTTAFSITGFTGGQNGRILTLINATTQVMTLTHQTSPTPANQINTGGSNLSLAANGVVMLIYNPTLTKWVVTGGQGFNSTDWALTGNAGTSAGTNFVGTTDAQDLVLKAQNTEGVRVSTAGNTIVAKHMAVGPNSAIDNGSLIQGGFTFKNMISAQEEVTGNQTTNFTEGVLSHLSINASNNPTTEFYALDNIAEVKLGNVQNYPAVIGAYGGGNHKGTGTVTRLYGTASYAQNKAAGTVTDLQGMNSYIRNSGAGAVTNAYGFFTKGMCNTGTGTVLNSYGVFVDAACNTGGGTVTNDYGVFIEDHSTIGATHYNLFSKGAGAKNYFAGNVGIGLNATSPIEALHIDKGTSTSAILRLTAGTTTGQTVTDGFGLGIDAAGNAYVRQFENLPLVFHTNNTEYMRMTGAGRLGIGKTNPQSTLDVNGSISKSIVSLAVNTTLSDAHHTVIITGGTIYSLPLASSCSGRIYILVNRTSGAKTVREVTTLNAYQAFSGTSANLPANNSITLQSDGTSWFQIQ